MCPCCEASPTLGLAPSRWVPRALAGSSPSSANPTPRLALGPQAPVEPGPTNAGSLQESFPPGAPTLSQPPLTPLYFCPNLPRPAFLSSPWSESAWTSTHIFPR